MTPEQNVEAIAKALLAKVESDYQLAESLFENYVNGYFRLQGYRSVPEFLREHFKDQEQDRTARLHARSFQRLIREYKLTKEIPAFKAAFDRISRSNRRLIAQVITAENAPDWIEKALALTYRELEDLITAAPADAKAEVMVTKRLRLYPGQLELLERAFAVAGKLIEVEGADPNGPEGPKLDLICQEFIGTYGAEDGFRTITFFECPRCGKCCAMHRKPEEDLPDGDRKVVVFACSGCSVGLAIKAFTD